jgi:hypothetical protein
MYPTFYRCQRPQKNYHTRFRGLFGTVWKVQAYLRSPTGVKIFREFFEIICRNFFLAINAKSKRVPKPHSSAVSSISALERAATFCALQWLCSIVSNLFSIFLVGHFGRIIYFEVSFFIYYDTVNKHCLPCLLAAP